MNLRVNNDHDTDCMEVFTPFIYVRRHIHQLLDSLKLTQAKVYAMRHCWKMTDYNLPQKPNYVQKTKLSLKDRYFVRICLSFFGLCIKLFA